MGQWFGLWLIAAFHPVNALLLSYAAFALAKRSSAHWSAHQSDAPRASVPSAAVPTAAWGAHDAAVSRDCCRTDYDALFDDRAARRELADYRRRGARGTTARLLNAIRGEGVEGASVLDIGGGVGVIGAELLGAGAASLTDVDASRPYLAAARSEIERRGYVHRATFEHGDFVARAPDVAPADIVTLDRVICCYEDWLSLVDRSVERARRLYGLVYPVDRWWMRLSVRIVRGVSRLFGQQAPFAVHSDRAVDARIRAAGFTPILEERGFAWQTVLYRRAA